MIQANNINASLNNANRSILGSINSVYQSSIGRSASRRDDIGIDRLLAGIGSRKFNYEARDYVGSLRKGAKDLEESLSAMTTTGRDSQFSRMTPQSSDESAVAVREASGQRLRSGSMDVEVQQLATGQKNQGAALDSAAQLGASGYYQFEVQTGGKATQVSFQVDASDTVETMQNKMAKAINDKNIGLNASVSVDSKAGTSTLNIASNNVGETAGSFSLRDVSGNAVAATATNNVSSDAGNAAYTVDGRSMTSESNTVDLGRGLRATLKAPTKEAVQVSVSADSSGAIAQAKDFVRSFNSLLDTANENSGLRGADRLNGQLTNLSRAYSGSLNRAGIEVSQDGYMRINEDRLAQAAENGDLENLFKGQEQNYTFSGRMERLSEDIQRNTGQYVSGMSFARGSALGALNTGLIFDFLL